jgi:hypothetical protein
MTLAIRVAGVDITDNVIIRDARFTMSNGPNPGDFTLRVKDPAKTFSFRAGEPIEVDFDDVRCFEGYVFQAAETYAFDVDDTSGAKNVARIWNLAGPDINILFRKRFIFNQSDPSTPVSLQLPPGTSDLTYLSTIMNNLTLTGDAIATDFHHVGSPNPDRAGIAASIGDSWERVMALTASQTGATWGLRPTRTAYYEDSDTETAPFAISDVPNNTSSFGYSHFEWLEDGTKLINDAQIWGFGKGKANVTYYRVQDAASIAEHGRWENPNGIRYDLYRTASVTAVTNSLVYGSPQNLHGGKDPSITVKCKIKRPGLMPGHKVRIISSVFNEEIVLPLRKFTMTAVSLETAIFELELSWLIDEPRNFFDYPPNEDDPGTDDITTPDPCDDLGYAFGWIDSSVDWQVARSHPWLGAAFFFGNSFNFIPKKRYDQTHGIIFIADYGDGIAGSLTYVHARHLFDPHPLKWAIQIDFNIPTYSIIPGYHLPPFPDFNSGSWWGSGDWTIYPDISLDLTAFGVTRRIIDVAAGVNHVPALGFIGHQPQGSRWHFEMYSNGETRCWPHGGVRPTSQASTTSSAGGITDEPFNAATYGPNRPWSTTDSNKYIYLRAQAHGSAGEKSAHPGTVGGNPTATNNTIRNNFINFTTGPTVGGTTSGYHDNLANSYSAGIPINDFRFITLPDSFNFVTQTVVDCTELDPEPVTGAQNCETLTRVDDFVFSTALSFAVGSTVVSVEGVDQRRDLDYSENVEDHTITFHRVMPTDAVWACYQVVAP